jgi:hypothetical protein
MSGEYERSLEKEIQEFEKIDKPKKGSGFNLMF